MEIEFDPDKDEINIRKNGISLAPAADFVTYFYEADDRFNYDEARFRASGALDGQTYCFVFTFRDDKMRVISLRARMQRR